MHAELTQYATEHQLGTVARFALFELIEDLMSRQGTRSVLADTTLAGTVLPVGVADPSLDGATWAVEDEVAERTDEVPRPTAKYDDLGFIAAGAMGEVRRVRDRDLNRTMAMKVISGKLSDHAGATARFVSEAQATAQLQHPNIVPVHDLGRLPDGRLYYTMKEVRGHTLSDAIGDVHAASEGNRWQTGRSGWTFRRLIAAFFEVCQAIGYAHSRGVVHRDLKPDNIMVGDFGQTLVLDWGLAKVTGHRDLAAEAGALDPVETDRSRDDAMRTRMGAVAGTPAYMPPEQAAGETERVDARSDVYALGAILYQILSGRAPYTGSSGLAVLRAVLAGPPRPVGRVEDIGATLTMGFFEMPSTPQEGPPLPEPLVALCTRAMSRDPDERYRDGHALAEEVEAWLDGSKRHAQALAVVEAATALQPTAEDLRAQADALRARAADQLADIEGWRPEEDKLATWAVEDEAAKLAREAELTELQLEQGLHAALEIEATLPEAHAALADRLRVAHTEAEAVHDAEAILKTEARLRRHAEALPDDHPTQQRCAAYLKGGGALTLVTDPPGAEVLLHRYEVRNRRLVPVPVRSLGRAPLSRVDLPMGSYLCLLRHSERIETRYPVHIGRQEHWDGVRPGGAHPHPVRLPLPGELGPEDRYIPAGWFQSGGDPQAALGLPRRRLWCDAFIMRRLPVTNRAYLVFLDDLVATGREEEALRYVPRERAGTQGELGAMIYGRDESGRFVLRPDAEGDVWLPDWPVIMVDWGCATAYAAWLTARTGQPWQLPPELAWEKAARGVDGRHYPWGDHLDPSWCCMGDSHPGRPLPSVVDSFPIDTSPYGVRGMGGNVRDWCADAYHRDGPPIVDNSVTLSTDLSSPARALRPLRGGAWNHDARNARAASRGRLVPERRLAHVGFRVGRGPVPEP